mgnify:CR=1 FL=1
MKNPKGKPLISITKWNDNYHKIQTNGLILHQFQNKIKQHIMNQYKNLKIKKIFKIYIIHKPLQISIMCKDNKELLIKKYNKIYRSKNN